MLLLCDHTVLDCAIVLNYIAPLGLEILINMPSQWGNDDRMTRLGPDHRRAARDN